MQSASSVTLIKFIAYVTLKKQSFSNHSMQIHIVQEFGDANVNASSIFFWFSDYYAYEKCDPDAVRYNIFADAYAVRNIFVDVNAVNNFLLLTLTPSFYFVARTSLLLYPGKEYLQLCVGDEHRQLLVRFDRRCISGRASCKKSWVCPLSLNITC